MIGKYSFPLKGINKCLTEYIRNMPDLTGKIVVDIPCGDGRASYELAKKGATVKPYDLYPEFLKIKELQAGYADMMEPLPIEDKSIDIIVCQEGIEHVPDQPRVLREFNRILKPGGIALITTPNYSHVRARISRFIFETDYWIRMPASEIDGIWFSEKESDKIYYGHLFLVGVHHMQTICAISGFRTLERVKTDLGSTSLLLGVLLYPVFLLGSLYTWFKYRKQKSTVTQEFRRKVLLERLQLNLSPKTLFYKHIFWVLQKEYEHTQVVEHLKDMTLLPHLKPDR